MGKLLAIDVQNLAVAVAVARAHVLLAGLPSCGQFRSERSAVKIGFDKADSETSKCVLVLLYFLISQDLKYKLYMSRSLFRRVGQDCLPQSCGGAQTVTLPVQFLVEPSSTVLGCLSCFGPCQPKYESTFVLSRRPMHLCARSGSFAAFQECAFCGAGQMCVTGGE